MPLTVMWSKWNSGEEFQYGRSLFLQTGSSYISAADKIIPTAFGLLIDFDFFKAATLPNLKLEVKCAAAAAILKIDITSYLYRGLADLEKIWSSYAELFFSNTKIVITAWIEVC